MQSANREFGLENIKETGNNGTLPTVDSLRASFDAIAGSKARDAVVSIFDEGTFVETSKFMKRKFGEMPANATSEDLSGVLTGYGAIDGKLACAFVFDAQRCKGAVDDATARKIVSLYETATKNGAPVIGVFDSIGADIFEGVSALSAYGKIMKAVASASGVIPQIALVSGKCIGTLATVAAMFDITVLESGASLYVNDPALTKETDAQKVILSYTGDASSVAGYVRSLVSFLPPCAGCGIAVTDCTDDLNRQLGNVTFGGDAKCAVGAIADNGIFLPVSENGSLLCALTTVGGVKCGAVVSDYNKGEGKLDAISAKTAARFVDFCDAFSIPVVTLVDSMGYAVSGENEKAPFSADLAKLAFAYAGASVPKVTVVIGHAIGGAFALLGSKSMGADVAYAVDNAEIGALPTDSAVAFAFTGKIADGMSKDDAKAEWKNMIASPVAAAAYGEIDDVISVSELRCRIASALLMLSAKGTVAPANRAVRPL